MRRKRQCVKVDCQNKAVEADGYAKVYNVYSAAMRNSALSSPVWNGKSLRLSVMNIRPTEESGLSCSMNGDIIIQAASGRGIAKIGASPYRPGITEYFGPGCAVFIPAGMWNNIISVGSGPLKLYRIEVSEQSEDVYTELSDDGGFSSEDSASTNPIESDNDCGEDYIIENHKDGDGTCFCEPNAIGNPWRAERRKSDCVYNDAEPLDLESTGPHIQNKSQNNIES